MGLSKKTKAIKGKAKTSNLDRSRLDASPNNYIRSWRLFRGIATQHELTALSKARDPEGKGLSREVICRLETGELRYNEDHLRILALALTVSVRDLIGTDPNDSGDIFAIYAALSNADKRRAAKQIEKLKR